VLMIGPGTDLQGGVSSVIRLILQYPPEGVHYMMLPTLTRAGAAAHLPRWHPRYYIKVVRNMLHFLYAIRSIRTMASNADLAHVHISSYGSTVRKYAVVRTLSGRAIPLILHNHGGMYRMFYNRLPNLMKARVQYIFQQAAGVIVLSEPMREFHRRELVPADRPVWLLPNPVVWPQECPKELEGVHLLFLGRLGSHKGSDRVLQALAQLPEDVRTRVRLRMAGDGAVESMRVMARRLGIESQVDIRSWIEGAEKERWLRECDVFILPSRAEGLPMAMLEAMAYGQAVIASPVGGIPEWVDDGQEGFLVPPDDIAAISAAIQRLAESPALRRQMGQRARQRVKPLSVENYRQQLYHIYEQVLLGTSRYN